MCGLHGSASVVKIFVAQLLIKLKLIRNAQSCRVHIGIHRKYLKIYSEKGIRGSQISEGICGITFAYLLVAFSPCFGHVY